MEGHSVERLCLQGESWKWNVLLCMLEVHHERFMQEVRRTYDVRMMRMASLRVLPPYSRSLKIHVIHCFVLCHTDCVLMQGLQTPVFQSQRLLLDHVCSTRRNISQSTFMQTYLDFILNINICTCWFQRSSWCKSLISLFLHLWGRWLLLFWFSLKRYFDFSTV